MTVILFFVSCGYFVWMGGQPFSIAGLFVTMKLISEFSTYNITALLLSTLAVYAYTALTYLLVDHFSDSIFIPLIVLSTSSITLFVLTVL